MKSRVLLAAVMMTLVLCLAAAVGVQAQDEKTIDKIKKDFSKLGEIDIPEVKIVTLDNGLRLYLLEDRALPVFNASARINCGSYLEPADKVGLAQICGSVMRTGGTLKWSGDELDEVLEAIGAYVETGIDRATASAFVNCLSEYQDLGLEVLSEVLRNPAFDEDKIDLAKVEQRTDISRRNDEVGQIARREFRKQVYGADSPYARHAEYATIDAITRDDLLDFHHQWFHPENVQLAVWGDFSSEEVIAKVKRYFGDWPHGNSQVPPLPPADYDWRSKVYLADKPDAAQTYIRMGHLGGMVTDEDYTDRIVMNSILGLGFGSRVTDNVRTKMGLAYSTGGLYISNYTYPGYFIILASTGHDNTVKATREMIKQIKSMQTDPPNPVEMAKGKDGYLNSFVFNFDSKREVINRIMEYDFYGLPEDFLQKEKEGVEQVTPEAVIEAAKRNLRPDDMIIVVAGNAAEFDEPLEALGLGPVDTLDITIPSGEAESDLAITPLNIEKGQGILAAGVDAAGGLDNFKAINSIETKGTTTLHMGGQELPIGVHQWDVLPNQHRVEMNFMGRTMYDVRDGDMGWKTDQMSGDLVDMTADDIAESDKDIRRNTTWIFKSSDAPYYRAVYESSGETEGTAVDWLTLVDDSDEPICQLAFATDDHRLVCQKYWGESPMGEGTMEHVFADHQQYDGVLLPTTTTVSMNGQIVMKNEVSERVVNGEITADTFIKPQ